MRREDSRVYQVGRSLAAARDAAPTGALDRRLSSKWKTSHDRRLSPGADGVAIGATNRLQAWSISPTVLTVSRGLDDSRQCDSRVTSKTLRLRSGSSSRNNTLLQHRCPGAENE